MVLELTFLPFFLMAAKKAIAHVSVSLAPGARNDNQIEKKYIYSSLLKSSTKWNEYHFPLITYRKPLVSILDSKKASQCIQQTVCKDGQRPR